MVPGLSGNLPFTASVEAQLDAFANAYFRPEVVIRLYAKSTCAIVSLLENTMFRGKAKSKNPGAYRPQNLNNQKTIK